VWWMLPDPSERLGTDPRFRETCPGI